MSDFDGYNIKKVTLNKKGIGQLLKSDEIAEILEQVGSEMGTIEDSFVGFDRHHVVVKED